MIRYNYYDHCYTKDLNNSIEYLKSRINWNNTKKTIIFSETGEYNYPENIKEFYLIHIKSYNEQSKEYCLWVGFYKILE